MKKVIVCVFVLMLVLAGCGSANEVNNLEHQQQDSGVAAIVKNQPVPDLGGYSFERQVVIDTYLARNNTVATYAYMISYDGKMIEICPSIGYPIPYSTQLTNPQQIIDKTTSYSQVIANSEPNGLYPPGDAAATLVQCVNPDGSVSPVYIEWYVLAFPFQVKADIKLERIGDPSFTVKVGR